MIPIAMPLFDPPPTRHPAQKAASSSNRNVSSNKRYTVIDTVTVPRTDEQAQIMSVLTDIHQRLMVVGHGHLPNDFPELGNTKPEYFGISLITRTGHVFDVGDYDIPFTLQSLSHPFLFSLALDDWGRELVLNYVNIRPSNGTTLHQLETTGYLPENPLVRSGALAIAGLVNGDNPTERLNRIIDRYSQYVGHKIHVDISTFMSSRQRNHHLRALGHLMINAGLVDQTRLDEILDLYLQQASVLTTGHDLAMMASTLANGGINPITRRRVMNAEHVKDVLSAMAISGMGHQSSTWLFNVGMPATNSVSGGLLAVMPGQFGVAIYSPLLDEEGLSIRGRMVCEELSQRLDCHMLSGLPPNQTLTDLLANPVPAPSMAPTSPMAHTASKPPGLQGDDSDPVIIPLLENDLFAQV